MCDLTAPHFQDADKAREYLENLRWPDGPVCPHCGAIGAWAIQGGRAGLYRCKEYQCRKQFTVTVGTVFERSRVPLNKWLAAVYLMCSSKKGVSSKQLERALGVTYKTAWFMSHRIREAMREGPDGLMGSGGGTVEVDETFIGHDKSIKPKGMKKGRGYHHKNKVLSLVERGGKVRSTHVPAVNAATLKPILREQIADDAVVYTDEAAHYTMTKEPMFQNHGYVSHGIGEYVRGDIHTNTIEGFFSIFKRGMKGIYQHCGEQHLKRYLCEYDFRYNYREKMGFNDMDRTDAALRGIEGKRLTYQISDRALPA
jgi:transposase-like protein